jgi:hypothetical protein
LRSASRSAWLAPRLRPSQAQKAFRAARNQRFSSWLRALAAFVLAELLLVQLLPALHHALVEHEVCAEHGDLVHGDGGHGRAVAPGNDHAGYHEGSSASHEHEHCGVSAAVRQPGVTGERLALKLEPEACLVAPAFLAEASASRSIELLALAPKLPPPGV